MRDERTACCVANGSACGTRWNELRAWVSKTTGKGVSLVMLHGTSQGKAPYFAQPVGYDGRRFRIASDHGCDTEKLLHEMCHWLIAPRDRRNLENFGLGPGECVVDDVTADNEEVTVMFLEYRLAPHFRLSERKIARFDYNVRSRRNIEREDCESRADSVYQQLASLPAT